jgi:hypothetical protein
VGGDTARKWTALIFSLATFALVILFPQMLYWYLKTGSIIYNSYHTPGNGLDLLHPNIIINCFPKSFFNFFGQVFSVTIKHRVANWHSYTCSPTAYCNLSFFVLAHSSSCFRS